MAARHDPRGTAALVVLVALTVGAGLWRWSATAAVSTPARTPFAAGAPVFRVPAEWLAAANRALPATDRAAGRRGPMALATAVSADIPVASGPHDLEFVCVGDARRQGLLHVTVPSATTDLVGFGCGVEPQIVRLPFYAERAGLVSVQTRAALPGAAGAWQVVPVRPVRPEWRAMARRAVGGGDAIKRLEVELPTLDGAISTHLRPLEPGRYRAEVVCVGDGAAAITAGARIPPRTRTISCDGRPVTYPVTVRIGSSELSLVVERAWGTGFLVWQLFGER